MSVDLPPHSSQEINAEEISSDQLVDQQSSPQIKKRKSFISFFIPSTDYVVTPIILNLNIIIFIVMAISGVDIMSPTISSLISWGANFRPETVHGQWWRLITSFFLHIGIFHLAFNMYALVYIGVFLEPYLGTVKFIVAYLLTGILASVTSLYWHNMTVSAGASGAIFGLYGVFLALLTTDMIEKTERKSLLTSISIFVIYNLVSGMSAGTDNAAHIGGLVSGLAIGYVFYPLLTSEYSLISTSIVIVILSITTFFTSYYVYRHSPDQFALYDEMMNEFASNESLANEVYQRSENTTPKEEIITELQDRGIYYWKKNIEIANKADKFDMPQKFHKQNSLLIDYCNLEIKIFSLLARGLNENMPKYQPEINKLEAQRSEILQAIKKARSQD